MNRIVDKEKSNGVEVKCLQCSSTDSLEMLSFENFWMFDNRGSANNGKQSSKGKEKSGPRLAAYQSHSDLMNRCPVHDRTSPFDYLSANNLEEDPFHSPRLSHTHSSI